SAPPVHFRRGDTLTFTVDPPFGSGAATMLEASGACLASDGNAFFLQDGAAPTGTVTWNSNGLVFSKDAPPSGCDVNLRLKRMTLGAADVAFRGKGGVEGDLARDQPSAVSP